MSHAIAHGAVMSWKMSCDVSSHTMLLIVLIYVMPSIHSCSSLFCLAAPSIPGFCAFANDYVAPTFPQIGLTYAAFYSLIGLSVVGGLYILAVIVKQIAVVRGE